MKVTFWVSGSLDFEDDNFEPTHQIEQVRSQYDDFVDPPSTSLEEAEQRIRDILWNQNGKTAQEEAITRHYPLYQCDGHGEISVPTNSDLFNNRDEINEILEKIRVTLERIKNERDEHSGRST